MNKYLLVIARYKDDRQSIFEKSISPKNKEYCLRHGIEYLCIDNTFDIPLIRGNPTWWKFSIVQDLIKEGVFEDGDLVSHFDADMVLVKPEKEYTTTKTFSYAIDNGNTHCMGNYCMRINTWSKQLLFDILNEDFYQKNKDTDHWQQFREQAAWYSLAGIKSHSWDSFLDMPTLGFHSNLTDQTKYGLTELNNRVEIKGPEWNTTLLTEEADDPISQMLQQYNIVKSKKEDTIIRHFAGGQRWRKEYLQ